MATNKISFRGEINAMSAEFFIREMENLAPRSTTDIYLHTPGGDIYMGGEMVNALRDACATKGCKFNLTLGSCVASMGASLLAAARSYGAKVVAHNNTEVMFHGCYGLVVGGADELTDQAKAMRDFNDSVKRDLAKCGIEDTEEWFAADRMKFLNAYELKDLNLIDSVLDEPSVDEDYKADALKIAACLNHKQENPKMDEPKNEVAENAPVEAAPAVTEPAAPVEEPKVEDPAPAEEVKPAEPEAPAPVADDIEAKVTALANERFAGLQAKHDKKISDLTKERDLALKDLEAAKAEATSLKAEVEKLTADLAATRDQLEKSEQVRESVVVAALAPAAELPTMQDGLAACATPAERSAFLASGKYRKN